MKGDVRVAPNGGVIIHKGLSTKAWFRAFSTGTVDVHGLSESSPLVREYLDLLETQPPASRPKHQL